ncbi:MAG: hypothetical protein IJ573_07275 [Clostridia bacterium]|nr:hypothetical protein [Clostridia bacterium]
MNREKELLEALEAADTALHHLESADMLLRSSGRWGWLDMLGGGLIVSLLKHGEMSDARRELQAAQDAVRAFGRELKDVQGIMDVNLETGDFLGFADVFFDGLLADALMQRRIEKARDSIAAAQRRIREIRPLLEKELYG